MKLTRIVNESTDFAAIAEQYFGDYYYDAASMGCWFLTMDDALYAQRQLQKEHKNAVYDVISYESPWKEAMDARMGILRRTLPVAEDAPIIDDDALINGDNDSDDLLKFIEEMCPIPLARGKSAITIAQAGVGKLYLVKDGMRDPLSIEEASILVELCPDDIHLYAKEGQE